MMNPKSDFITATKKYLSNHKKSINKIRKNFRGSPAKILLFCLNIVC